MPGCTVVRLTLAGARLRDAIDAMAGRVSSASSRSGSRRSSSVTPTWTSAPARWSAAVGEATLNAARHSGATEVSVYVEVEDEAISAYVRDHGAGFDPDRWRPTGGGSPTRSSGAWSGTAELRR